VVPDFITYERLPAFGIWGSQRKGGINMLRLGLQAETVALTIILVLILAAQPPFVSMLQE
jgi:hypothetical protein